MATLVTTRALCPDQDWAFFRDDLAPVAAEDRAAITVLDEASAQRVWDEVVAQDVPATVVVCGRWLCELLNHFAWHDAWTEGDDNWAANTLRERLNWDDHEEVLFIERPRRALKTHFGVFLRAWRTFLLDDDEGPLLVNLNKPEAAWFHPSGGGLTGQRPHQSAAATNRSGVTQFFESR